VTLGNFATKYVLQTTQGITRTRGQVHAWHGRTVIPTFHPAAILHGGGEKSRQFQDMRDDFVLVQRTLAETSDPAAQPAPDAGWGRTAPAPGQTPRAEPPLIIPEPAPEEQLGLF
jgi:hypothetical protein